MDNKKTTIIKIDKKIVEVDGISLWIQGGGQRQAHAIRHGWKENEKITGHQNVLTKRQLDILTKKLEKILV